MNAPGAVTAVGDAVWTASAADVASHAWTLLGFGAALAGAGAALAWWGRHRNGRRRTRARTGHR